MHTHLLTCPKREISCYPGMKPCAKSLHLWFRKQRKNTNTTTSMSKTRKMLLAGIEENEETNNRQMTPFQSIDMLPSNDNENNGRVRRLSETSVNSELSYASDHPFALSAKMLRQVKKKGVNFQITDNDSTSIVTRNSQVSIHVHVFACGFIIVKCYCIYFTVIPLVLKILYYLVFCTRYYPTFFIACPILINTILSLLSFLYYLVTCIL